MSRAVKTVLILAAVLLAMLAATAVGYRLVMSRYSREQASAAQSAARSAASEALSAPVSASAAAPDFSVEDAENRTVLFEQFRGRPAVINFWASWSVPSQRELAQYQELYLQYGGRVQFMMINLTDGTRETMKSAKRYIQEKGYTFPVYFDTHSTAADAYAVLSIPDSYFIGRGGRVRAGYNGAVDRETMEKGLKLILNTESESAGVILSQSKAPESRQSP